MSILNMNIACSSITDANLISNLHPYGCFFYCCTIIGNKFIDISPIDVTIFI